MIINLASFVSGIGHYKELNLVENYMDDEQLQRARAPHHLDRSINRLV